MLVGLNCHAQFKVVGPPPFLPAEAHRKIKSLLDQIEPGNSPQTVKTISDWVVWYRDILDEELLALWKSDRRANLNLVVDELANAHVSSLIAASWRQPGLSRANAPALEKLMTRYPESAQTFVGDLIRTPELSQPESDAVCRILIDLPDQWRANALQILPHYRGVAQGILDDDLRTGDIDKVGRAQFWQRDLHWDTAGPQSPQSFPRRRSASAPVSGSDLAATRPQLTRPDDSVSDSPQIPRTGVAPSEMAPAAYNGAQSGTLSCGRTIPQNAEFVFREIPPVRLKLEYDVNLWEVRLLPGTGQTQRLLLKNISSGPQKKCIVHWTVIQ